MSMRYKGGVISATPPTTSGASAIGMWTLEQQFQAKGAGNWPPANWIARVSGSNNYSYGVATDSSLNVYFGGAGVPISALAVLIQKFNSIGVAQWQRTLRGPTQDQGLDVDIDSSGNVFVSGFTSAATFDALIAKYNTSGVIQWQRTLASADADRFTGIAVDPSGNVYAAGYYTVSAVNYILVAKYNTSGVLQWQRRLGGDSLLGKVAVDSSGNVYVCGTSVVATVVSIQIAKYNTSGVLQWQRRLSSATNSQGFDVAVNAAGDVHIVGSNFDNSTAVVAKYDTSGTLQWQRAISGIGTNDHCIAVDNNNDVYVSGFSTVSSTEAVQTIKYNSSGVIQWQRTLDSTGVGERGKSITTNIVGNYYVAGLRGGSNTLPINLPSNGSKTGTYTLSGSSFTYAASSLTDAAGTLTSSASSLTDSATSLTDAASSLTDASISLTNEVTIV